MEIGVLGSLFLAVLHSAGLGLGQHWHVPNHKARNEATDSGERLGLVCWEHRLESWVAGWALGMDRPLLASLVSAQPYDERQS